MFSTGQVADQLAADIRGVQQLRAGAHAGDAESLKAAAKQFEALFVQTMLKTMRQTHFSAEGDVFTDSSSLRLYQELLDQQWAQKLVQSRGLGFAEIIVQRLGQDAAAAKAAAVDSPGVVPATGLPLHPASAGLPGLERLPARQPAPAAASTGTAEAASTAPVPPGDHKRRFIETLRPHAEAAEARTGIPARFILAHAALESGWGAREILDADGNPSHNLFGIKAGASWDGDAVQTLTTEFRHGLATKTTERFRAYAGYEEAFADYAALLQRRYRDAVAAGDDAGAFAAGLVKGGYATDPAYAAKLNAVIGSVAAVTV